MAKIKIRVYHGALWAPYKGLVFSAMHAQALTVAEMIEVSFVQMCRSSRKRKDMNIDLNCHRYPFKLLFDEVLEDIPIWRRCLRLFSDGMRHHDDLVVLPGYHRLEYWFSLLACLLRRKKRVVSVDSTFYDRDRHFIKDILKRVFFMCCDGFLCYGSRGREYLSYYGIPGSKVEVDCQTAALPTDYSPDSVIQRRLSDFPRQNPVRWLFVGRLAQEKAVHILLHAFALYQKEDSLSRLTIVGGGPLEQQYRHLVTALNLNLSVCFTGTLTSEQIVEHYSSATALILPSASEPWGLVVNEALSFGCPVIISDRCGCVPELVKEGKTGYIFKSGRVKELCEKMHQLSQELRTDPTNAERYARECIETVKIYTPENAASHILGRCLQIFNLRVKPFASCALSSDPKQR